MMPKPAIEQIDDLLLAWEERLRRMDENLVALEGEPAYQLLAGKAGARPVLEGRTRDRVGPALDAVTDLFENHARLGAVVAQARDVRASISALTFWDSDAKMAEILRLLRSPSIALDQEVIAIEDRSLLDESHHDVFVEPEALLAEMVLRFEEARKALLAVSRALRALGREMKSIEEQVASLRALAAELAPPAHDSPISPPPELADLAEAEADLTRLRARVVRDPLGLEGTLHRDIARRLVALGARLQAAVDLRRRVLAALDEARALKRRLDDDHTRARSILERARRDLAGASIDRLPPPLDDGLVLGLDAWLRKLEATVRAQRWPSAEVGLLRFREAAVREHAAEAAATATAEALLARPGELAGRLSARRAQAAALASRGLALDAHAEAAAREAEALLLRRPLPIDDLTRAVEAYESAVIALAPRR
ncbi:MAG: hypothetical protein QM820_08490 [Minicystis sp.]